MNRRVRLPAPVAATYGAVSELEALYPQSEIHAGWPPRRCDQVVAARSSWADSTLRFVSGNDAFDENGDVQIKTTASPDVALYNTRSLGCPAPAATRN